MIRSSITHYKDRKSPWIVRWYDPIDPMTGDQKRRFKAFRTKWEAEDFKAEQTQKLKAGEIPSRPSEITLDQLSHEFIKNWNPSASLSTIDLYKQTLERLKEYYGRQHRIRTITPRDADAFLAAQKHYKHKRTKKLSVYTKLQIVRMCKCIFTTAEKWHWIRESPFKHAKLPKPSTKRWHRMTVPEYRKLLKVAPNLRWQCLYALAYTGGARIGELHNLTWHDIDFKTGRMNIENRDGTDTMAPFVVKTKEARYVQLPADTIRILKEYKKQAPIGVPYILFTRQRYDNVMAKWRKCQKTGDTWDPKLMTNNIRREFLIHVKRAELKFNGSFSIHTFRKCCAQNWADHLPPNVVKFYMGHSTIETTNRFYSIVDESHLDWTKKATDKMLEPDDTDSQDKNDRRSEKDEE